MELQKDILSLTGNLKFKENSRVEKSIPQCPTLSEAMSVSEEEEENLFSGLGTDVWIAPKSSVFDDGEGILIDDRNKDAVHLNLSKDAGDDNTGFSSPENNNPFKQGFPCSVTIDFEDHLRSACELAKCVMPYGSKLPYFVRYDRFDWDFVDGIGLEKPWRFYNLPRLLAYHLTSVGDSFTYFCVNDVAICTMTSEEFAHCLSNERWADLMKRQ